MSGDSHSTETTASVLHAPSVSPVMSENDRKIGAVVLKAGIEALRYQRREPYSNAFCLIIDFGAPGLSNDRLRPYHIGNQSSARN
jgi:hypothetical protein